MHPVQIFVEDELNEAFEMLAAKAMGVAPARHVQRSHRIRAAKVNLDELMDFNSLLDLTERSRRSGCEQVVFVIDSEGPGAGQGRRQALTRFHRAFQALCDHLVQLSARNPLGQVKVVRVEVHSCLESWLLGDKQAIANSIGKTDYVPSSGRTDHLTPRQAREQIAHIVNEVGKRRNNRYFKNMRANAVKSLGKRFAPLVDLARARANNASLDYFCDMIARKADGCQEPFPQRN